MCVNYVTVSRQILYDVFDASVQALDDWPDELYQDYLGPIIIHNENNAGERSALVASYGMIPKRRLPPGQRFTTMNARAETVGQLRTYKPAWVASQLCLVPMRHFFEPNWEQPAHVRWKIGMIDEAPFAVAGLYKTWLDDDGSESYSFTQITINADDHTLMRRFHKPGEEKRSLVIVAPNDYDDWLACRDPERARTFLRAYPAELMRATPAPKAPKVADKPIPVIQSATRDLF